jgi:hypothetical protein
MKTYIFYNTITGEPIQTMQGYSMDLIEHILDNTTGAIELPTEPTIQNYYINSSGEVVEIPVQPSSEHTWNWTTKQWENLVTEEMRKAKAAQQVLVERKKLLDSTDWIVIKAMDTGTPIPTAWQTYRQELRDVTNQTDYPYQVTWPTKPTN